MTTGQIKTIAQQKLKEFVEKKKTKGIKQNQIASDIGCSRSYLSELLNGSKKGRSISRPSIALAGRIENYTRSVKIGDWYRRITE